jgi:hypothetical protein
MNGIVISFSCPQIFELFHIFKEFNGYLYVGIFSYISDSSTSSVYCGDLQADHLSHHLLTYPALGSKLIHIRNTDIACSPSLFINRLATIICHVFLT